MAIAIVIPSFGRKTVLEATLRHLFSQTTSDDCVIVSICRNEDRPALEGACLTLISGPQGSVCQRNSALRFLEQSKKSFTAILFIDDDVILAPQFLRNLLYHHLQHPEVAGYTCHVVSDGAKSGRIPLEKARTLAASWQSGLLPNSVILSQTPYVGFSMRGDLLEKMQFDNRLAEYGFMEDFDFFARLRKFGPTAYAHNCGLVHLAASGGRTNHRKFGFSQITNPIYLSKKGSLSIRECIGHSLKALASNALHISSLKNRQRFYGNLLALKSLFPKGPRPELVSQI